MRALVENEKQVSASAEEAFRAALGVAQNTKNFELWAVHNEGRRFVAFEKAKMSNAKVHIVVIPDDGPTRIVHAVGSDPRSAPALLDKSGNKKAAARFLEQVDKVLTGSEQAPVTPVDNFYLQKKERVAWVDPQEFPEIDLGLTWRNFVR